MEDAIKRQIKESIEVKEVLLNNLELIAATKKAIACIIESYKKGGKLLIMGNGGSASQAQHFAAELVNKFRADRRALPAIALTADTSSLTSIGNDSGFDYVFSRQIEALGRPGDICFILTTSDSDGSMHGHSTNLWNGLKRAREMKLITIGLVSQKTKNKLPLLDCAVSAPSEDTARIQEIHGLLIHIISEEVEKAFLT